MNSDRQKCYTTQAPSGRQELGMSLIKKRNNRKLKSKLENERNGPRIPTDSYGKNLQEKNVGILQVLFTVDNSNSCLCAKLCSNTDREASKKIFR